MTKITSETVNHVAELARLEITDDEREKMTSELNSIVEYIDQIAKLDVADVEEELTGETVADLRGDEVVPSLERSEFLSLAPESTDEAIEVPKVIE